MTQTGVKNSLQLRLVEKKCSLESGLGGQAASGLDEKKQLRKWTWWSKSSLGSGLSGGKVAQEEELVEKKQLRKITWWEKVALEVYILRGEKVVWEVDVK